MLQKMKMAIVESVSKTRNEYGEIVNEYDVVGRVPMFIDYTALNQLDQNDVPVDKYTHTGITPVSCVGILKKGYRINDKYIVKQVIERRPFSIVYLSMVE